MHPLPRRSLIAVLQFVIFSNSYIALCAVVMCLTTIHLFTLQLPDSFLPFIFFGTLGSYSLHIYLTDASLRRTDRECWVDQHKQLLLGLFIGSMLIGVWLLTRLTAYLIDLLPVVALTFLYTAPKIDWRPFRALRQIAVLKTAYLALVWTYVTVALPLLLTSASSRTHGTLAAAWFLNRFLLIYGIALCFDYRDRAVDRQSRWLTIVSMLTGRQVRLFFGSIVLCFGLTVGALYSLGWTEWTLLCVCLPMILLVLLARRVIAGASDYGYYVCLDGLLMLTGILLMLAPDGLTFI